MPYKIFSGKSLLVVLLLGVLSGAPVCVSAADSLDLSGGRGGDGGTSNNTDASAAAGSDGGAAHIGASLPSGTTLVYSMTGKGGSAAFNQTGRGGDSATPNGGNSESSFGGRGGTLSVPMVMQASGGKLGSDPYSVAITQGGGGGGGTGGGGYAGGGGGGGGQGVGYIYSNDSDQDKVTLEKINLRGGDGGNAGLNESGTALGDDGGGGGGGGAAIADLSLATHVVVEGSVGILGGDAGLDADTSINPDQNAEGGHGGRAFLQTQNLTVNGESGVRLYSGNDVDGNARGGMAALRVLGELRTPVLRFTKGSGGVHADINTLNMSGADTTVSFSQAGAAAWSRYNAATNPYGDNIAIRNLVFGAGRKLSLSGNNPGAALELGGSIAVLRNSPEMAVYDSAIANRFDATRSDLVFAMLTSMQAGDVFLDVTGAGGGIVVSDASRVHMTTDDVSRLANVNVGDRLVLMRRVDGGIGDRQARVLIGSSLYTFDVASVNNAASPGKKDVVATLNNHDDSGGKLYNLSNVSRMLLLNNGHELHLNLLDLEADSADFAFSTDFESPNENVKNEEVYVDVGGGSTGTKPKCSLDLNDYHVSLGVKIRRDFGTGRLLAAFFGETGQGHYRAEDDMFEDTYGNLRSKGDVRNYGGGFLARIGFANGWGFEASVRGGSVWSELKAREGMNVSYDSSTWYVGMHGGVSRTFDLGGRSSLRAYGKYVWNYQGPDRTRSSAGERLAFSRVNSNRFLVGARYVRQVGDGMRLYADAAWEYESDGRVVAGVDGRRPPTVNTNSHLIAVKAGGVWKQALLRETGRGWEAGANVGTWIGHKNGVRIGGHLGYSF